MPRQTAISEPRAFILTFDDGATGQLASVGDAYKAVIEQVMDTETKYAKLGAAGVPDLTGASVLITGALPFQYHVFTVTTVMATGSYEYVFVETKPSNL